VPPRGFAHRIEKPEPRPRSAGRKAGGTSDKRAGPESETDVGRPLLVAPFWRMRSASSFSFLNCTRFSRLNTITYSLAVASRPIGPSIVASIGGPYS